MSTAVDDQIEQYIADVATFISTPRYAGLSAAQRPTRLLDYLRCSTIARPCRDEEVDEQCTYQPKTSWARSRGVATGVFNAPYDWPYCQNDLDAVYAYCTYYEQTIAACNPIAARERMFAADREAVKDEATLRADAMANAADRVTDRQEIATAVAVSANVASGVFRAYWWRRFFASGAEAAMDAAAAAAMAAAAAAMGAAG